MHGCIGAVDPVRTFGNAEQKSRFLPRLASGASLSGFALTEPGAGSDLTALRTTAVSSAPGDCDAEAVAAAEYEDKLPAAKSRWFGVPISWFDSARLGWHLGFED